MLSKYEFYRWLLMVIVMKVATMTTSDAQCVTFSKCIDCPLRCVVKTRCFRNRMLSLLPPEEVICCVGTLASPNFVVLPAKCIYQCDFVDITYPSLSSEREPLDVSEICEFQRHRLSEASIYTEAGLRLFRLTNHNAHIQSRWNSHVPMFGRHRISLFIFDGHNQFGLSHR